MNKQEFIEILSYNLGNVNEDIRKDIIADFHEHFEFAMKSGKTEEEACTILGDPKEIAGQFIAELRNNMNETNSDLREHSFSYSESFNTPPMQPVYPPPAPSMQPAPPPPISEWKTVKGSDLRTFNANISGIMAQLRKADVNVSSINGDIIEVRIEGNRDEVVYSTEIENGVLIIKEKTNGFGIFVDFFGKSTRISIAIPVKFYGFLTLTTGSGDISANSIDTDKATFKTGSGDISIKNSRSSKELLCGSGSGDINASDCQYNAVSTSTGSGDIELLRVLSIGHIALSTGSGDLDVKNCAGEISASTGSGDVSITSHKGSAKATTGAGDILIDTDTISDKASFGTGAGDVKLKIQKLLDDIKISTGSGDIDLTVNELRANISAKTGTSDIVARLDKNAPLRFEIKHNKHTGKVYNDFAENNNGNYLVRLESGIGDIKVKAI